MQPYPKMQSIWQRDSQTRLLIPGQYAYPQFERIQNWYITEKIDGTNIRVIIKANLKDAAQPAKIIVLDRHGRGLPPAAVKQYVHNHLRSVDLSAFVENYILPHESITLYGEGFGSNIQARGENYSPNASFILFDVKVGSVWQPYNKVVEISKVLNLQVVPVAGPMSLSTIIDYVKQGPISLVAKTQMLMEGIVAFPDKDKVDYFEDGTPIKFKLRHGDFVRLEKESPAISQDICAHSANNKISQIGL